VAARVSAPDQVTPFLGNVLLFGRLLRRAGLPVTFGQTLAFARALEWIDLGDRDQVFHAARSLLVFRAQDLRLFATLFALFWRREGGGPDLRRRVARPWVRRQPAALARLMAARADEGEPAIDVADRSGTFSAHEVLQQKDFAEMTEEELAAVRRLIDDRRWEMTRRRSRRLVSAARGERLHLRRVLREAARHGGVALRLHRLRRKVKQRPVVLLADVSGSMERYTRLVLQLFYSMRQSLHHVECFVFGTRLTRITRQLELRNPDRALEAASREVLDWAGGTRIGESLAAFNRRWARQMLRRGAVVVVVSDGWERGDVSELVRELGHLARRCHRLIWLNPHVGRPGYAPEVEGMAAALPFVDDFLPAHDLRSLAALAELLIDLPARRRVPAPRRDMLGNDGSRPLQEGGRP
jgi:uncharacterized protein with von Willebrand factor type A (vWA) domain